MKKLYLLPFLAWFILYGIFFIFNHVSYPGWVVLVGSIINITSEICLLVLYYNVNLKKIPALILNLINFCWYLYYLPTDVSGINGNLEWTLVFTLIDITMIIISFDNLIYLWHNAIKKSYSMQTISRHMLVTWYISLVTLLILRGFIYARR